MFSFLPKEDNDTIFAQPIGRWLAPKSIQLYEISVKRNDWYILVVDEERTVWNNLNRCSLHFSFPFAFEIQVSSQKSICYRPHPKDGEGNVFSLFTPGGGQVQLGGSGSKVNPARGRSGSKVNPARWGVRSSWGGQGQRSIQPGGSGPAGGGQVSRGVRVKGQSSWGVSGSKVNPARGVRSSRGGGGGVRILRPLAGGMPLAFTQDFLVEYKF